MSVLTKFLPKKEKPEFFLTLGIEEHHIRAAVASILENKITLCGSGESDFSEGDNETEACDIAISMAEKNLPNNTIVEKVIFALPQIYLSQNDIKPEYFERIKKISHELHLKPAGYIEYPASIVHFLEKEEGTKPTVLIVSVGKKHITLTLIRVGKVEQSLLIARSESVIGDLANVLPKFSKELLPSRIILYDETERLDDVREELLRYPWHKHFTIYHTPKIEILSSGTIIRALVEASGSSLIRSTPDVQSESFGFKEIEMTDEKRQESQKAPIKNLPILILLANFVGNIFNISKFKIGQVKFPIPAVSSIFALCLTIFTLIIIFLAVLLWFVPRSSVSILVYPLKLSQIIDISFSQDSQATSDNNVILAALKNTQVEGKQTIQTTGETKVGEAAKGEVTIYNKTLSAKTFPKGTLFESGNLMFILDSDSNIASSSDTGEGLAFGKSKATMTAVNIGPSGNLANGTVFTFKDFPDSSYTARATSEFSGGTSREISSVSDLDQTNLEETLTKALLAKAKEEINQKLEPGEQLIESSINKKVILKKFDNEIGTEARELSLNLTLNVEILSFKPRDLVNISMKNNTPELSGFSIDIPRTSVRIISTSANSKGIVTAKVETLTYYLPTLPISIIQSNLRGKTYEETAQYLKTIDNIAGIKIRQHSTLPFERGRLPYNSRNLQISIQTL